MIRVTEMMPSSWRGTIAPAGRVGIGCDLGTTTKAKSNPTAIAVVQESGNDYIARLVIRFKTSDPGITESVLRHCCDLPHNLRVRRICIDATSERFFAADLRKAFAGFVPVVPVIASESLMYRTEKLTYKQYLGNLLINTINDGRLALPASDWLEKDLRQVVQEKGSFDADVDEYGNHADCFDAIKLALHALIQKGGPVSASAARVGSDIPSAPRDLRRLSLRPIHDYEETKGALLPC